MSSSHIASEIVAVAKVQESSIKESKLSGIQYRIKALIEKKKKEYEEKLLKQ
jgi:hypothetical protein